MKKKTVSNDSLKEKIEEILTPYRISSATPSTSWVMLPIVIPKNFLRKKERKVGENSKYLIVENSGFLTMGC